MKRLNLALLPILTLVLAGFAQAAERPEDIGPLAEYVARADESFRWTKRHAGKIGETEYAELVLTSQTWKDIAWKHQLFVIKPSSVAADVRHGLFFISGGSWRPEIENGDGPSRLPREASLFASLAEQTGTPIAVLSHVPHQPILGGMYEDQIIAHTFAEFLKTGDPQWPLLLPMVKSAVRGMDTVQAFLQEQWKLDVRTFTVTGASKRGWTTWLTGAVDPRVTAIAPMVIDMLNMASQMEHQKEVWGAFSEQIADYTRLGLQDRINTPRGRALQAIVDPFHYRDRLVQPKLILLGTNDPYWPLDAANLYWDELNGPKYLLYIPNNGHGLNDFVRITGSLNALHQHIANGKRLPDLKWEFKNGDGRLTLQLASDMPANKVQAWVATSPTRDFRQANWRSFAFRNDAERYVYDLPLPADGYAALFGEAVFTDNGPLPYFLSTNVKVVNVARQRSAVEDIRSAVAKALPMIETGVAGHLEQRVCFSCHSQALPVWAVGLARQRGFDVDQDSFDSQLARTHQVLARWEQRNPERTSFSGGQADTAVHTLLTLDLGGWKPDETTAAVVEYLLLRDRDLDHWRPTHDDRLPSEGSPFTTTALAVRGLQAFGTAEQQERIEARIDAARQWLRSTQPRDTEDRVFRLWGLKYAQAEPRDIATAAEELLESQRPDGGWSQTEQLDSDAYATGSALVALHLAGQLDVSDPAYQRGAEFLVGDQQADGSWHVRSRSTNRFQSYFETGFPHDKDQWISIAASSWATSALALACSP